MAAQGDYSFYALKKDTFLLTYLLRCPLAGTASINRQIGSDRLRFHVHVCRAYVASLDTKQVITETFLLADLLAGY